MKKQGRALSQMIKITGPMIGLFFTLMLYTNCSNRGFQTASSLDNSSTNLGGETGAPTLSAVLGWDKSSSQNISGYRIYFGRASKSYDNMIDVGPTSNSTFPEYEILNLDPKFSYYAIVKAYDSSGRESVASNEIVISAN